jgi:ABC-type multidrug transport system ATPase subunit
MVTESIEDARISSRYSTTAIEVRNATVAFGQKRVLSSLTLSIESGMIVGLIGPNGVGKTTLLRLIAGLIPDPTAAFVRVDEISIRQGPVFRQKLFFIEDIKSLDSKLSGWDYLRYTKHLWRSQVSVEDTVKTLGIASFVRRPLRQLSQGMQQQIMLAMAFVSGAAVILLDEPMNSLDPGNTDIVSQQLCELKGRGATILLSTHLPLVCEDSATRKRNATVLTTSLNCTYFSGACVSGRAKTSL